MYTSANKPFISVGFSFLVHHIEAALLLSTFGCAVNMIMHPNSTRKCRKTLLNEQTFLAGFCFNIRKDGPTVEKEKKENKQTNKKKNKKKPPSNNKSVITVNAEHLFPFKTDLQHRWP